MTAPFDPYLHWLGIEGEGIPSHYELLGLRLKESNAAIIQQAANARLARLRKIDPGPHREVWEQLIAYLEQVRAVLSDPGAKAEYDATLPDPAPISPEPVLPEPTPPPPVAAPTPPPKVKPTVPPGMPLEPSPEPLPKSPSPPETPPPVTPTAPPTVPPVGPAVGPSTAPSGELPVGVPLEPLGAHPPLQSPSGLPVGIPIARPVSDSNRGDELEGVGVEVTPRGGLGGGSQTGRPLKPRKRGLSNNQLTALFVIGILIFGGLAFGILKIRQRDLASRARRSKPVETDVSTPRKPHPLNDDSVVSPERRTLGSLVGKDDPGAEPEKVETGTASSKRVSTSPEQNEAKSDPPPARPDEPLSGTEENNTAGTKKSAESPEADARFQDLLSEARRRIGARDLEGASSALEKARKLADTPERNAEWDQVCSMRDLIQAFWSAIRDELDRHKNEPMTISYAGGNAQFVVVECNRDRLVIRKEGETVHYAVKEMPHNLVVLMARNLLEQNADAAAMTGAFIAMEPDGDREDARRLLEKAAEARTDLKRVLSELDVPRFETPNETRLPIPTDETKIARAQYAVKKEFKEAYDAAKSGPKRVALSETLVAAGTAETTDRLRQYVLFDDAVRYAVVGGSAKHALRAVDAMSRVFAVDTLETKTAALSAVARRTVASRNHRDLVPLALELAREAAKAGRKNQLERLIEIAKTSARKTGSAGTMKEVMDFERGVK